MTPVIDLSESRKAKMDRCERFSDAARELVLYLERQREAMPTEFLTFLIAMAIADQALAISRDSENPQAGRGFIEQVFLTTQQLFDSQVLAAGQPEHTPDEPAPGRVLEWGQRGASPAGGADRAYRDFPGG